MSVRKVGERGFSDFLVCQREGLNETLDRLGDVIDWRSLEAVLAPVEPLKRGAPGYPALVLLRCLFVGELYGLSDPGLEAAISDRLSFRRFAGFSLDDAVPDHSTLWRFREDLRLAGLDKAVFEEIMGQLDDQGLIMRKGTILDATIIEAQASRPRKGDKTSKVDKDARFTKKGGKSWFGYKAHVGMDEGSGLIRSQTFTAANRNDTEPADELVIGDERAIYADAAYDTHARRARLKACGIKPRIMFRPNKHHPKLSARKALFNRLVSKTRASVERLFGDMKRLRGWHTVRAYSRVRNAVRFTLLCTILNLKRATVLLQ
jgi:IS5 family transposase